MTTTSYDATVIDNIITGYLPHSIYAFETNTYPNYLKVGDTNRRVETRLNEWRKIYHDLEKIYEAEAMLKDKDGEKTIFFRDYSIHDYLIESKNRKRLSERQYEREFFKNANKLDLNEAIIDVKNEFIKEGSRKYNYYQVGEKNTKFEDHWERTQDYKPRPNQKEVIDNIVKAVEDGRKNLLLYAVMRFGKSNVAIWSAKELDSKLTVVVTGKADVKVEWQKTVESHIDFKNFIFTDSLSFTEEFKVNHQSNNIVVFTTLQDLAGSRDEIKAKHEILFKSKIDLLVIDESHFGARAKIYSKTIESKLEDVEFEILNEESFDEAIDNINVLNSVVKLHLSGTPYRILLSGEFSEKDIVGKVQFSDILEQKSIWTNAHTDEEEEKPWINPYFGFAEMIRFAFLPNKKSVELLENLKQNGESANLNVLFSPETTSKRKAKTVKFKYESDVISLLSSIDGSELDENIFPFLDYHKIKDGKLAHHMVIVLPYKNSVDAMERLLNEQRDTYKNLGSYEILNVAGNTSTFNNVSQVQNKIKELAENNKKTITLTVNKMLTGSTVPEWDTMIFFKDTKSPQDYDQAIFRLQSPWIKEVIDTLSGKIIGKEDMKPQTLLIDFSPNRVFEIESERALVVNASEGKSGNDNQEEQLRKSISFSPIIYMNKDKLIEATPIDIIDKIRKYSADRSIIDEVIELPIDDSLYKFPEVLTEISIQEELGSKKSFKNDAYKDGSDHLEGGSSEEESGNSNDKDDEHQKNKGEILPDENYKQSAKQMQMYYSRILFYAFLCPSGDRNMSNIINNFDANKRLARHLGLNKSTLKIMKTNMNAFILATLDNKIENISDLRIETMDEDILKAIAKFGRISPSEIFTPINIAKKMIDDLMNEEFIDDFKKNPKNIIDLSSKSGVYLILAFQKLSEAGIDINILKDKLFGVATSHIGYEFTRAVYEDFGWNLNNLVDSDVINSYQLINESSLIDKLKEVYGDDGLKFDVIIGNPPYQEGISETKENSSLSKQIFPSFIQSAIEMDSRYVSLVTPSRWFTASAQDKSFIKLRKFIKEHNHLSKIYNYPNSKKVFDNVQIAGGINYFVYDKEYSGNVEFVERYSDREEIFNRPLFEENLDVIIPMNKLVSILRKVKNTSDFIPITTISKGRDAFGVIGKKSILESVSSKDKFEKAVQIRCAYETFRYIDKEKINKNTQLVDKWKIFVSKSNGGAGVITDDGSVAIIGKAYIGQPYTICTDSLIPIGNFNTEIEAINLQKYMKTKFLRVMVGLLKASQNILQNVYQFVPIQDFTLESSIDWTKTISEIDQQLYEKYNFDDEEITFIESKIKSM